MECLADGRVTGFDIDLARIMASLMGASLTIAVDNSSFVLGTWQKIVFVDFDNRTRRRRLVVQIMGEA